MSTVPPLHSSSLPDKSAGTPSTPPAVSVPADVRVPAAGVDPGMAAIQQLSRAAAAAPEEHKPELVLVSDGPIDLTGDSTTVTLHPPEHKPELILVSDGPIQLVGDSTTVTLHPPQHEPELILVSDGPISLTGDSTTITLHPPKR